MHEFSLINNLMQAIKRIAEQEKASRIISVKVKLGALSHISSEHFREHFVHASQGTIVEGANLAIEVLTDTNDPLAQEIILDSIDVE